MKYHQYLLFLMLCSISCSGPQESTTEKAARVFFEHYKTRNNWEGFQQLYAEDMVFEDVIFQYTYDKEAFVKFYNWPDPQLRKHPDYPEVLILEDLAFTDSSAVGRGYFTPFYYADVLYADTLHMRFTMWLYFTEEGKIRKHIDYIEYPPAFLKSAAERLLGQDNASQEY